MFEAKLKECITLKKIVDSIKDIVSDVNLEITPNCISLQAMDTSHVALVSLNLSMDGFDKYRADTNMILGISISNLAKVMKLADTYDTITLKTDSEINKLIIIFENENADKTTTFTLNLLSMDSENLSIPETQYSSIVTLNSQEFAKLCRELSQIHDTIAIKTTPEYIQFSVDGEIGSGQVKLGANEGIDIKKEDQTVIDVQQGVSQQFALKYLNLFNKGSSLSNYSKLYMQADQPLVVEFPIDKLGSLKFYLAPKITEEGQ